MKAKDIMHGDVMTIKKTLTVYEAVKIFIKKNISGAPVVDDRGKMVGILSEKDIFRAMYPKYDDFYDDTNLRTNFDTIEGRFADITKLKVRDVMTRDIIAVSPDTSLIKIGAIMLARKIHRVLVREKGKPLGIITRRDVYRSIFKNKLKI